MKEIIEFISPFEIQGIVACLVCGGLVGLERQISGKPAGIRTSIMICFSTYIFISLSTFVTGTGDPSRVLGQVVTGIGFLGGGVIILTKDGLVEGVTSASIIWLLAALGCMIGFGYETHAVVFTVLALVLLVGFNLVEKIVRKIKIAKRLKRWKARKINQTK